MNFIEKNNLLPSLKGVEHIQNDIKLLRKLSPNHKLLNQSNDLNQFNIVRISSNIILALLDLTSCELIKSNRDNTNIDTTDQQSTPNAGEAPTLSNKTTKFEEYPDIDWNNNSDANIQMCILLYDDRIRTYKRMKEIDAILDDKQELSQEMVELDILNKQAQDELKSYNNDKCFLFIHNFTQYLKFEFESEDGDRSTDKFRWQLQSDWNLDPVNLIFARSDMQRSQFSSYKQEDIFAIGYGRIFFNDNNHKFNTEIGPGYKSSVPNDTKKAVSVDEFILRTRLNYERIVSENLQLTLEGVFEMGHSNSVYSVEFRAQNRIYRQLYLTFDVNYKYYQNVPVETVNQEVSTGFNIMYAF